MKLAVVGSRGYDDYEGLNKVLSTLMTHHNISLLISGGAKGADSLAERFAEENGIKTKIIIPDWAKLGKKAGPMRNSDIVKRADLVVAFWDGESKGTLDTIKKTKRANKDIIVIGF